VIILDKQILCRIYFPELCITNITRKGKASNFCFFNAGIHNEWPKPRAENGSLINIEKFQFYFYHAPARDRQGHAMNVTVTLHIKNHCIETEARNEYRRLMDIYFSTDDLEGELDKKIELLRDFLEKSDFPKLRASDARLSGGQESYVLIKGTGSGAIELEVL
jgi:hypothetical protein